MSKPPFIASWIRFTVIPIHISQCENTINDAHLLINNEPNAYVE